MKRDEYPRVTHILSGLQDFGHIPKHILKNKQRIGTRVHKAIQDYMEDSFPVLKDDELGYFDSFVSWHRGTEIDFTVMEQRFYDDELMFSGQIDALGVFKHEGMSVLVDFKTSAVASPKVWPLQGCMYRHLLVKSGFKNVSERFLFLKLDKGGKPPKVFEYKWTDNQWAHCKQLISAYHNKC